MHLPDLLENIDLCKLYEKALYFINFANKNNIWASKDSEPSEHLEGDFQAAISLFQDRDQRSLFSKVKSSFMIAETTIMD